MEQAVQVIGAMLILVAYIGSQQNRMQPDSVSYLGLNVVGSAILAVIAVVNRDAGFLLLEGVWTIVSVHGLVRALRTRPAS